VLGPSDAFLAEVERAYRADHDRLWRALLLFSGDREIASDAVAEAFAQVLRRGESVRQVEAWVWRAAFRIAAGELFERRRLEVTLAHSFELPSEVPSELPADAIDIIRSLKNLSPKQRGAIVLRYYGDRGIREIAASLETTPSAVAVHLHRAKKRLRQFLQDDKGDHDA
jgi:RNA polymerase sigma-70 factor (ECF subfamily)